MRYFHFLSNQSHAGVRGKQNLKSRLNVHFLIRFISSLFILMIAIPSLAVEVLFVGGGSAPVSGADEVVMGYLQNLFGTGNVDYLSGSAVSKGSEEAYDLLIISSTLGSGTVRNKFEDSTLGIVNWEEALMDDSSEGDFFLSNTIVKQNVVSQRSVTLTGAGHPIQGHLPNGNIVYVKGGGDILFSNAGDGFGVESIGHDSGNTSRKFIQYAEVGAALLGIGTEGRPAVAAGRRVSFSLTDSNFDDLTPEGLTLFENACHWAAGAMEVVMPSVVTLPIIANHPATNRVSHGADIGMEVKDDGGEPPIVTVYYGGHDGG
ncbi:MAG TPA: hypothetical protein EYG38_17255, partial [Verrucomicrobia bacterium]|nr:hypothetical protein [Verrucomicrobiota bacterium]